MTPLPAQDGSELVHISSMPHILVEVPNKVNPASQAYIVIAPNPVIAGWEVAPLAMSGSPPQSRTVRIWIDNVVITFVHTYLHPKIYWDGILDGKFKSYIFSAITELDNSLTYTSWYISRPHSSVLADPGERYATSTEVETKITSVNRFRHECVAHHLQISIVRCC